MKIHFGQVYIDPGARFPFSHVFQGFLSDEITKVVVPSDQFIKTYGSEFDLNFNVSAKKDLQDNEIKGPGVYRKSGHVEYSIFLPYDVIANLDVTGRNERTLRSALQYLFKGVYSVFTSLGINPDAVRENQESLIEQICSNPSMLDDD